MKFTKSAIEAHYKQYGHMAQMRPSPVGELIAEHARAAKPVYKTENYNKQSNPYVDSPFAKVLQLSPNKTPQKPVQAPQGTVFLSGTWGFLTS